MSTIATRLYRMASALPVRSVIAVILLIAELLVGWCVDRAGAEPVLQESPPVVSTVSSSTDSGVTQTPAPQGGRSSPEFADRSDRANRADLPELGADSGADHSTDPQSNRQVEGVPAKAYEMLAAIQQNRGKPPPGYVGGRTFMNRERRLPSGRYREYDIHPLVPGKNRGAERIVVDQRSGKAYFTGDHYRSFIPIN